MPIWFHGDFKMCFTITDIYFKALKKKKKGTKHIPHEEYSVQHTFTISLATTMGRHRAQIESELFLKVLKAPIRNSCKIDSF